MTNKVYLYVIQDNCGLVIQKGVIEDCRDICLDFIVGVNSLSDRCIWDIQHFLDKNYKELRYTFSYVEYEIDIEKKVLGK